MTIPDLSPKSIQHREMKKAFYGGLVSGILNTEALSARYREDKAVEYLETMLREAKAFYQEQVDIANGRMN